jgi:hypothetical protein
MPGKAAKLFTILRNKNYAKKNLAPHRVKVIDFVLAAFRCLTNIGKRRK